MTARTYRPLIPPQFIEFTLAIACIAGLINLVDFFFSHGYLPAPFVFDVSDTFMDWFNTAFYAHRPGAYDVWHSIYAPFSFVILRIFGEPACFANAPADARDCDIVGIVSILASYAISAIVAAIAFHRNDRSTALFRSIGFALGLPLLYALERGNLIMISFIFFIVMFGNLTKSRWGVSAAAAAIINLKTYLLFPVLMLAVQRRWRLLELCGIATIGLYLVTIVIMNGGTPFDLVGNLNIWFNAISGAVWDQVYYSTTYAPYLEFDVRQYPIRDFIPQRTVDIAKIAVEIELIASRAVAVLCIGLAWFYPRTISIQRLAFFALMQSFIVQNPGGYAIALVTFLVFMEKWESVFVGLTIVLAYIISVPTDRLLGTFYNYDRISWLSGHIVDSAYGISLGALFRPGLLAAMLWLLAIDSLIRFHRAIMTSRPALGIAEETLPPPIGGRVATT